MKNGGEVEKLSFRLSLLKDSGVIDQDKYDKLQSIISYFKEKENIVMTDDNSSSFITHISMVLNRIEKNEKIESLGEDELNDLMDFNSFEKANKILSDLELSIFGKLPEYEKGYILAHLINLLEGVNNI